jgi:hypothetical protein
VVSEASARSQSSNVQILEVTLTAAKQPTRRELTLERELMTDETIFTACDLTAENPPGICSECAKEGVLHEASNAVFVFCPHRATGALRDPDGQWDVQQPVDAATFRDSMLAIFLAWDYDERMQRAAAH